MVTPIKQGPTGYKAYLADESELSELYDTLIAEGLKGRQALYGIWFLIYQAAGSKQNLKALGLPGSKKAIAKFLNVEPSTIYEWQSRDWFQDSIMGRAVTLGITELWPKAMAALDRNLGSRNGAVSNTAAKIVIALQQQEQANRAANNSPDQTGYWQTKRNEDFEREMIEQIDTIYGRGKYSKDQDNDQDNDQHLLSE